jgi:hypothetical protein
MSAMAGMAKLMAEHRDRWNGTLITLFQPAEETGEGAQDMVDDGLFKRIPVPDVALAQHLLPGIAGTVRTRPGPFMSAADSIKVTVYGRGGHGSTPQNTVDPVVLAARQTVSEDFRKIPDAAGVRYCYWGLGYTYLAAEKDGRLEDLTTNHSPKFLPPIQPTPRTGTEALLAAALAWLAP